MCRPLEKYGRSRPLSMLSITWCRTGYSPRSLSSALFSSTWKLHPVRAIAVRVRTAHCGHRHRIRGRSTTRRAVSVGTVGAVRTSVCWRGPRMGFARFCRETISKLASLACGAPWMSPPQRRCRRSCPRSSSRPAPQRSLAGLAAPAAPGCSLRVAAARRWPGEFRSVLDCFCLSGRFNFMHRQFIVARFL